MTTLYTIVKDPPINLTVLQRQITDDPVISVNCEFINFDGATNELSVAMAADLSGPQLARLTAVVAAHNGTMKNFEVIFPIELIDDFVAATEASALGWAVQPLNGGNLALGSQADANHPGVIRVGTGALAAGAVSYHLGLKDVRLGGGLVNLETMLKINQIATGLNQYVFNVGLGDTALGEGNNALYISYDPRVSANWIVKSASQGNRSQFISTIPVDTGWHRFSLVVAPDGALAQFFVDDAFVGELASNIPLLANCGPNIQLTKVLGLAAANVDVDYFYFCKATNR